MTNIKGWSEDKIWRLFDEHYYELRSWIGEASGSETINSSDGRNCNLSTATVIHFSRYGCLTKEFAETECRCIRRAAHSNLFYEQRPHLPGHCPFLDYI